MLSTAVAAAVVVVFSAKPLGICGNRLHHVDPRRERKWVWWLGLCGVVVGGGFRAAAGNEGRRCTT